MRMQEIHSPDCTKPSYDSPFCFNWLSTFDVENGNKKTISAHFVKPLCRQNCLNIFSCTVPFGLFTLTRKWLFFDLKCLLKMFERFIHLGWILFMKDIVEEERWSLRPVRNKMIFPNWLKKCLSWGKIKSLSLDRSFYIVQRIEVWFAIQLIDLMRCRPLIVSSMDLLVSVFL